MQPKTKIMEFNLKELLIIKDALQYGMIYTSNESEEAEFAYLLLEVQKQLIQENNG